jgi:glucan phosphoethanolaminetransferase (alkaline phosphatase superfamily)
MKIARWFLYSAVVILLFTAVAKFISSFGHGTILLTRDPFTNFQFRDLFRMVGSIETAVALVCIFSRQIWFPTGLVAWLATSFVVYRLYLYGIGYQPCSCLGNLTDALHIPPQPANTAMKIILAYLLIGSYATLFWLWRQRKNSTPAPASA